MPGNVSQMTLVINNSDNLFKKIQINLFSAPKVRILLILYPSQISFSSFF